MIHKTTATLGEIYCFRDRLNIFNKGSLSIAIEIEYQMSFNLSEILNSEIISVILGLLCEAY